MDADQRNNEIRERVRVTESIIHEVVEGVTIAVVGELVVRGGEFLEALCRHAGEVSGEPSVFSEDNGAASNEAVDQRLLSHRRNHNRRTKRRKIDSENVKKKMTESVVEREMAMALVSRERESEREERTRTLRSSVVVL